jgi:hypothetical protein
LIVVVEAGRDVDGSGNVVAMASGSLCRTAGTVAAIVQADKSPANNAAARAGELRVRVIGFTR